MSVRIRLSEAVLFLMIMTAAFRGHVFLAACASLLAACILRLTEPKETVPDDPS